MVFNHAAIALELLALTSGAFLLLKASQEGLQAKTCFKLVGYFVVIASTLTLLGSVWNLFSERVEEVAIQQHSQTMQAPPVRIQNSSSDGTNQIVLQRNRNVRQQQERAVNEN